MIQRQHQSRLGVIDRHRLSVDEKQIAERSRDVVCVAFDQSRQVNAVEDA